MTDAAPKSTRLTPVGEARQIKPNSLRFRRLPARYGFAIAVSLIALGVTMVLLGLVQKSVFIFFWPAVIASAWFGGLGPALLSALLAVILVDYFVIPPAGFFLQSGNPTEILAAITFVGLAMITSWAVDKLEHARNEASLAAGENLVLAKKLDDQSIELSQQLEESQAMQEELEASTEELAERTTEAETASRFSRGVLESISDPFVVHDSEWRFQYLNSAASQVFNTTGLTGGQVTGKVVWDLFPSLVGTPIEKEMRRAAESRIPGNFEAFSAEQGTWSELRCYPLPDGGLGTQWKDITERKKGEEASRYLSKASELLSSSLNYEKTLAELAHLIVPEFADWCAIAMVDDSGKPRQLTVAHANQEKIKWAEDLNKKYPPPDDSPTGVPQVIRSGKAELYSEIPQEMLEAGAIDDEHLQIIRELGLRSAMVVPISTPQRTLGAITVVSAESGRRYTQSDLDFLTELARRAALAVDNAHHHTAELEARKAAEAANEAKTQFLAVMSHELRTPLNAIGGYAELLLLGIRGALTHDQRSDLERIQRSQRNLLSLINDILNYAKLEAGHVVFDMVEVDLNELLQEVEPLITPQLRSKDLTYSSKCEDATTAWGDAEKIRQILLNLLSNAIKFTENNGEISVTCECDEDWVNLFVKDTGLGIPADKVGAVFEPFVQLERKLTSGHEGTGLGLAISRDLARGLGGDLSVSSSSPEGTVFQLRLRRKPAAKP
jgi:PAS domain S-box-containing protein